MTHGKDWMVGASTCSVGKATPEVVRAYAEAGLDAMEISLKAHEYAALDLPALRRAADDTGLTIWSLHLPFSNDLSIAHKDAQVRKKAMETNIALLRKLGENGISHAVVHPGTEPTADADRAERLKESRENLCLLTEEAIKDGVQLCVEELPRTCPGNCSEEMAYLLEAHPRLRLCFDTNHLLKESHEHFLNAVGSRVELQGTDVFYTVSEPTLSARPMTFEFHRRYTDIHVPVTGEERIALCPASSRPADTPFDSEKDIGFFPGRSINTVRIPAGWFCVCFPEDAHVPCLSDAEEHAIVKLVLKVRAS